MHVLCVLNSAVSKTWDVLLTARRSRFGSDIFGEIVRAGYNLSVARLLNYTFEFLKGANTKMKIKPIFQITSIYCWFPLRFYFHSVLYQVQKLSLRIIIMEVQPLRYT